MTAITDDGHAGLLDFKIRTALDSHHSMPVRYRLPVGKLEAVGRLAGGVAHDFNNLLAAIMGMAKELHDESPQRSRERRNSADIMRICKRAFGLTRQLMAFSRQKPSHLRVFDANGTVRGLVRLWRRSMPRRIGIFIEPSSQPALLQADEGQLEQILTNLVLNARDALPRRGQIRISLRVETEPRMVRIDVSDNGVGMSPEVQAHLFEPFFTTKASRGTGLGLATVYGLMQQNGGHIDVQSQVGQGTSFTLRFPFAKNPLPEERRRRRRDRPSLRRADESVTLVEDNALVRRLVATMLRRQGYRVMVAAQGSVALKRFSQHPTDLLITDMVMPEMSGPALAQAMRRRAPNLPIIFISGFAGSAPLPAALKRRSLFVEKSHLTSRLLHQMRLLLEPPATDDR